MLLENAKMKEGFEQIVELAGSLASLKSHRDRLIAEANRLPENRDRLELAGKTVRGEKERLDGQIKQNAEQERVVRRKVQDFLASVNHDLVQSRQKRIPEFLTKRLRVRDLLTEAAVICEELEEISALWDIEVRELKKRLARVIEQTAERYPLPESPLPSPFVPLTNRTANETGKTSVILKSISQQIS